MKIITGGQILELGKSMAELGRLTDSVKKICESRYACKNDHQMNGGDIPLDQWNCKVCGKKLERIGPK